LHLTCDIPSTQSHEKECLHFKNYQSNAVTHYILAAPQFHNFGMQKFSCFLIWHFSSPLIGKLNFCSYISQFYLTHEIRKYLMHIKNMCFAVA